MMVNLLDTLTDPEPFIKYPHVDEEATKINNLLASHGIKLESYTQSQAIIQYNATIPVTANINKLMKLEPNMRVALNCDSVQINIKGNQLHVQKPCNRNNLYLSYMYTPEFIEAEELTLIMGVDIDGNRIYTNLSKQPHMLVAGTTGSGKSMFLHQCIISLLMKDKDIELYAIDTKQVEFNAYKAIPNFHYITDEVNAVQTLARLVDVMEGRYKTFADKGYRDITHARQSGLDIKPIVCVIDEFADLIMRPEYSKTIESYVVRLAQKSRAAGIHLIIATQRPTTDVITGLIKANIPSRVCLHVDSAMNSRIIIDAKGGENLIGYGDMLFKSNGSFEPIRLQSCYISPTEMQMIGNNIAEVNNEFKPVQPTQQTNPQESSPRIIHIDYDAFENEIMRKRRAANKKKSWIDKLFNR